MFDEKAAWDWNSPSTGEAGGFTSTFIVEHLVIHGGGDAGEEVPSTPGGVPSTPAAELSTPGVVPSTSGGMPSTPGGMPSMLGVVLGGSAVVATTPGRVPSTPVAEPRGLAVVPTTPRLRLSTPTVVPSTTGVVTSYPEVVPSTATRVPSTPGGMPSTLMEQGTPSTPIEFASPPSDITEFVDAFHEGEEVRFHRLDDIVIGTSPSELAARLLNDAELLLVSVEEPPTFALAERDGNWRRAMLEEMKAIEENETWQLVDPPQDAVRSA